MTDQAQRILPAELEFRFLRDHAKAEAEAIAQRAKSTLAMYSPIPEAAAMADVVTRLQEAMRLLEAADLLLEAADHYETLRVQAINESQPTASSAVEQAKAAIVAKLEQALAELRSVNQSMRGIPCPACAEKDQQIARAEAEITRLRELMTKEMKDKQQGAA